MSSPILFLPSLVSVRGSLVDNVTLPAEWSAFARISGDFGNGDILTIGAGSTGGGGAQLHVHNGALRLLHSSVAELHNFGLLEDGVHDLALYWTADSWRVNLDGVEVSGSHEITFPDDYVFLGKANGSVPDFEVTFAGVFAA